VLYTATKLAIRLCPDQRDLGLKDWIAVASICCTAVGLIVIVLISKSLTGSSFGPIFIGLATLWCLLTLVPFEFLGAYRFWCAFRLLLWWSCVTKIIALMLKTMPHECTWIRENRAIKIIRSKQGKGPDHFASLGDSALVTDVHIHYWKLAVCTISSGTGCDEVCAILEAGSAAGGVVSPDAVRRSPRGQQKPSASNRNSLCTASPDDSSWPTLQAAHETRQVD